MRMSSWAPPVSKAASCSTLRCISVFDPIVDIHPSSILLPWQVKSGIKRGFGTTLHWIGKILTHTPDVDIFNDSRLMLINWSTLINGSGCNQSSKNRDSFEHFRDLQWLSTGEAPVPLERTITRFVFHQLSCGERWWLLTTELFDFFHIFWSHFGCGGFQQLEMWVKYKSGGNHAYLTHILWIENSTAVIQRIIEKEGPGQTRSHKQCSEVGLNSQ